MKTPLQAIMKKRGILPSIIFFPRVRNKKAIIYCTISHKGESSGRFSLKIPVDINDWSYDAKRCIEDEEVNEALRITKREMLAIFNRHYEAGEPTTPTMLRDQFWEELENVTVISLCERLIERKIKSKKSMKNE